MICDKCGKKLQRLFTSVYCPFCETIDNRAKNKTNNPDLLSWECIGQVTKISRYQEGYVFSCIKDGLYTLTFKFSTYVKYEDIRPRGSDSMAEWFVDKERVGGKWCLYYRAIDKVCVFTCYSHTLSEV